MQRRAWAAGAVIAVSMAGPGSLAAQEEQAAEDRFGAASGSIEAELAASLAELTELRESLVAEKVPLHRQLNEREAELATVRGRYQAVSRDLDSRKLDVTNLTTTLGQLEDEEEYLASLFTDFVRKFCADLHVCESRRYAEVLDAAELAPENSNLSTTQVFDAQLALVDAAFTRLEGALGGDRFGGSVVDAASGQVLDGTFVLLGPYAVFRSRDGRVGTAELRLGSLEPTLIPFANPQDVQAADSLVATTAGYVPFDPTLGNAHKIEALEDETFLEHVEKGGAVMVPIFLMAGLALLVALYKWIGLALVRKPSGRRIQELMESVRRRDEQGANERARAIRGPIGQMLQAGVEHLREPRELVEEVMYEVVLTTRLKLQRMLPFIAICAASAPLLGLLGTVSGIINTFKMITEFGSSDVKSLSGGISEALITTKFGLIVAIPSLLIHSFLSRKARGVVGQMESAAVRFGNEVARTQLLQTSAAGSAAPAAPTPTPSADAVPPGQGQAQGPGQGQGPGPEQEIESLRRKVFELTKLQTQLSNLGREQERMVRLVDAGSVEIATLKAALQSKHNARPQSESV
jgi:biopolymer transport protein ExbB